MNPAPPTPASTPEHRALAAIVFTDVVAFTRHIAANEAGSIAAMGRDFDLFRRLCGEHGGTVLNTMGDGMLMTFSSAVEAMQCAVSIQQELHRRALADPRAIRLEHRIGVHVGDVVFGHEGVLGDGINVAARVESLCRPSAIAFSRSVYEIIRGKYDPAGATYLGPRRGKNLEEPIPIWEVPPIMETLRAQTVDDRLPLAPTVHEQGATGRRSAFLLLTMTALLGCFAVGFVMIQGAYNARHKGKSAMEQLAADHPDIHVRKSLLRHRDSILADRPKAAANDANSSGANSSGSNSSGANSAINTPDDGTLRQLSEMKQRYDFAGIVKLLQGATKTAPAVIAPLIERYTLLDSTRQWADAELLAVPPESPVLIGTTQVFASQGNVVAREGGKPDAPLNLWGLPPATIAQLLTALSTRPNLRSPAPDGGVATFAEEYRVTPASS